MKEAYSVLIVDDHPFIVEGYINTLASSFTETVLNIDKAFSCEQAVSFLQSTSNTYNVVILDISLPPYRKLKMNSGEDLGVWVRQYYPNTKIFVITSYDDAVRLNSIAHNISPEGFLLKSESTSTEILSAFKSILEGKIALGPRVSQLLLKRSQSKIEIDDINLQILSELSNGTRTIDLPKYIPLSKSGIEKRKRLLKSYFNKETDTDRELIMNAKKCGYL